MAICAYCGNPATSKHGKVFLCEFHASAAWMATKKDTEFHVQSGTMTPEDGRKILNSKPPRRTGKT